MTSRCARAAVRLACLLSCLALPSGLLQAQNENETVGFSPTHAFEAGHFGETVDTLNGGLNLTTPIGQRFQVNARLGYGLTLSYNSKVWDSTYYGNNLILDPNERVVPANQGNFGIGFSLSMGRIFKDYQYVEGCNGDTSNYSCFTTTWKWVSPDGSQHDFFFDTDRRLDLRPFTEPNVAIGPSGASFDKRMTGDLSYARISGPGNQFCYGAGETGCFRVETPDGLVYTLTKRVDCQVPPLNGAHQPTADYQKIRIDNESFCGWYTKLIEDPSIGTRVTASDGSTVTPFPNKVEVTYDGRPNFQHAITGVSDSSGRSVVFHSCEWWSGGHCSATTSQACNGDSQCPGSETCYTGVCSATPTVECNIDSHCPPNGGNGQQCVPRSFTTISDMCFAGSKNEGAWTASDRSAVATYEVKVPSYKGDTAVDNSVKATYGFMYEYTRIRRGNYDLEGSNVYTTKPALKLVRIDYPAYTHPISGSMDLYSLYFGYHNEPPPSPVEGGGGDYGEVSCRTLPLLRKAGSAADRFSGNACSLGGSTQWEWATFKYSYGYYKYIAKFLTGSQGSCRENKGGSCNSIGGLVTVTGTTRQMVLKRLELPTGTSSAQFWRYTRAATYFSNPTSVIVTDPFGNDTVYYYHASQSSDNPDLGPKPEDGAAPEWNDGSNFQTDYFRGSSTTGVLLRSELQEQDADGSPPGGPLGHSKSNVRAKRSTTRYLDSGMRESNVSRDAWDNFGHWTIEVESGFDVDVPRTTRSVYQFGTSAVYMTDLLRVKEVSDGRRVLARTENEYDSNSGKVKTSIVRSILPATIGTPVSESALDTTRRVGDVMTTYVYDTTASGNLTSKTISTGRSGETPYVVNYTYAPDPADGTCPVACYGYLASKTFAGAPFKSIDRVRDGNTGLIIKSRDTARVQSTYSYDSLGRITQVVPAGEEATQIEYESLVQTTVTQGTRGSDDLGTAYDFLFTRYVYDGLGRQVATQKRPADPTRGFACQRTQYDIANHVLYKSEWQYRTSCPALPSAPQNQCWAFQFDTKRCSAHPSTSCITDGNCPSGEQCIVESAGTEYDLREPGTSSCDPFGRVHLVIPADADRSSGEGNRLNWPNITRTDYSENSSTVTVNGIRGAGGTVTFFPKTVYQKDALGRLIRVDAPDGKRCNGTATVCSQDSECGGGSGSCVASDGGADAYYDYDALDRLERVNVSNSLTQNQIRRFAYDGLGHLLWTENPESGTTVYTGYDALGNLLSLKDSRGNAQRLVYDFAGRLKEQYVTSPGGVERLVARNSYDLNSGAGHELGKITKLESFDENGQLQLTENRSYDGLGARLSIVNHIFADWTATALNTLYSYNTRGLLSSLRYPRETTPPEHGSLEVTFAYANGSVVTGTAQDATQLGRVTYNPGGGLETVETPGNGRTRITYDSRNRPATITAGKWGSGDFTRKDYESGAYAYDGAGNIYQIGTSLYGYDAASRLIWARTDQPTVDRWDEVFNYDVFGNMVQRQLTTLSNGLTETEAFTFSTPNTNRVMTRQTTMGAFTAPSAVNLVYDASGNILQGGRRIDLGSGIQEDIKKFDYGALNRLLGIQQVGGATLTPVDKFGYDSSGNRLWKLKDSTGVKTYYVRDPSGQVLSEFRRVAALTDRPEWTSDYVSLAGRLIALKENLRPEPPSGLSITQTQVFQKWTITLTWNHNTEPDRASYVVYRKKIGIDPDFVSIGTPTNATFADTPLFSPGLSIQYQISCKDTAGNESIRSAIAVVSGDTSSPSAPSLSASGGDTKVTLTYSSSDNAAIKGFEIYRGTSQATQALLTAQLVPGPVFTDLNLTNNTTYYYKVRAKDTSGNIGAFSAIVNVTPTDRTPPSPPKGVTVASTCGAVGVTEQVKLIWEGNPADEFVTSYEVYRGAQPDTLQLLGTPTIPSDTKYTDSTAVIGTKYFYAVKAVDNVTPAGNRSEFSQVVQGSVRDSGVTPQVQLFARATDGLVALHWQPVQGAPAPNPTPSQYIIYRKLNATEGCGNYVQVASLGYAPSGDYSDGAVPNNAAYDYSVVALVNGKESSFSRPTLGIPLDRPSSVFQCRIDDDPWIPNINQANAIQWSPPAAKPYQPLVATNVDGTVGYLKGYHLYHHKVCDLAQGPATYQDDSPTREVVVDLSHALDPYLIDRTEQNFADQLYLLGDYTTLSPPFSKAGTSTSPFYSCTAGNQTSCAMPRAVYKIYAEGTWLTRESDWPTHFNPSLVPSLRCMDPLRHPSNLPWCEDTTSSGNKNFVPVPTGVTATANGPGSVSLTWSAPTIAVGKPPIAGYFVYGRGSSDDLKAPLPFATLGPNERTITIAGLVRQLGLPYALGVVAFDTAGHASHKVIAQATPASETAIPGPPRSLRAVLWTINDSVMARGRGGIKLTWVRAAPSSPWTVVGYRVYRSAVPEGPYCALLLTGQTIPMPSEVGGLCASDVQGESIVAVDGNLTTVTPQYWDKTTVQERLYHYRVSQIETDGTTSRETPFAATEQVDAKGLGYDVTMLPPPQGFRAWAPQHDYEPDRRGIYLRWCQPPAATDLPSIQEYRVYRKHDNVGQPYRLLARLNPACLATDSVTGMPTNRCVIDSSHWCVDNSDVVQSGCTPVPVTMSAPNCGTTTGIRCGVVDLTANCWPPKIQPLSVQDDWNSSYFVTVVSTSNVESMPSNEDQGWLNYCADESVGTPCTPRAGSCDEHRDPDGNGEFLVCGDESAALHLPEKGSGLIEVAVAVPQGFDELEGIETLEPLMAPHRTIGQTDPGVPSRVVFYHSDHLGSPRVILDINGDVVMKHHYLPFGEERPTAVNSTNPTINTKAFTGHERDQENGLDYMLARYYSSSLGRFMAVDPVGDVALGNPQSWNAYAYTRNNPVAYSDPTGTSSCNALCLAGVQGWSPDVDENGRDVGVGAEAGKDGASDSIGDRRGELERANLQEKANMFARRVSKRWNGRSVSENREYGGLGYILYGQFAATPPARGPRCDPGVVCEVDAWGQIKFVPAGAAVIFSYHSHAAPPGGEAFSWMDVNNNAVIAAQSSQYPQYLGAYLATPTGAVYFLHARAFSLSTLGSSTVKAIVEQISGAQQLIGKVSDP